MTAQTFKDSIERTLNPAMHSYSASYGYLADVVGARRYMAGKASHITGIVARGETLTVRLTAAAGDFLSQLALPGFCAVPSGTPAKPNLGRVPSAGPYYVTSYTPGQGVVLARNPNYHGDRPHRFAQIELMVRVPAARTATLARGPQQYFVNPAPELHYLALNTHRPLFSDLRLRQAVNYAIDRRELGNAR